MLTWLKLFLSCLLIFVIGYNLGSKILLYKLLRMSNEKLLLFLTTLINSREDLEKLRKQRNEKK